MSEENSVVIEENDSINHQLTPEQVEILKKFEEEMASRIASEQEKQDVKPEKPVPKPKYPSNIMCRCTMIFFFVNGSEYKNEINVSMDRIQIIQEQMAVSLENKDGKGVIYLEGSKNSEADFTVIPAKNILYMKLVVEEATKI